MCSQAPGTNDAILRKLRAMTPPVVRSREEGEALPGGGAYMVLDMGPPDAKGASPGGAKTMDGKVVVDDK